MSFENKAISVAKKFNLRTAEGIILIAVVIAIIVIVVKAAGGLSSLMAKIGQGLGFQPSPAAADAASYLKQQDTVQLQTNSPFNPQLYLSTTAGGTATTVLADSDADNLAETLWNAFGTFTISNPSAMQAAIEQCANQVEVSQVSSHFASNYGRDLYTWLRLQCASDTNMTVLEQAVKYANALPQYS